MPFTFFMINPSRKLPIFIQKLVKLALFSFLCAKTIINKSLSIFIIIYHYIIPVGLIHYCQACFVTKKQKILGISTPPPLFRISPKFFGGGFPYTIVDDFSWQKLLVPYWHHQHCHHHRLRHHHHHPKYMTWKKFTS